MRCTTFRDAFSARPDGEEVGLAVHDLDAHLAGCAGCQAWARAVGALSRAVDHAPREQVRLDPSRR